MLQHKTIIYGGHTQWLKRIKGLLTEAKFVKGKGGKVDYSQIGHYHVLWIYIRGIDHSMMWSCVEKAKNYGVPYKIFKSTSVDRCVEEIIAFDGGKL